VQRAAAGDGVQTIDFGQMNRRRRRCKEKAVQSEEDDGEEAGKGVGKGGALDLSRLMETGLLIFQEG